MISREEFYEIIKDEDEVSKRLLPDDISSKDLVDIWKKYEQEDNTAICGTLESKSIREINQLNSRLYKACGLLNHLPEWGSLVEIGAGYGSIKRFLAMYVDYYPCDIIERTPETIVLEDYKLPFEDETKSTVVSVNCFQHITPPNRLKYIKEAHRVLDKQGMCFVTYTKRPIDAPQYAITGDFIVPYVTSSEINSWFDVGFSYMSSTVRNDGFTGLWMQKYHERTDAI